MSEQPTETKSIFYHPFISQAGLENLRSYAYHGVDNSLCGRLFLNAFWERVVKLMPMWLAPNLITLAGGIFCFTATVLAMDLAPTYIEVVPSWACFAFALLIFLYQTMDNIDGKQARRTGAGSPLGELFDHGVDSLVMGMFVMIVSSVLRAGGYATVLGGVTMLSPFYFSHWEEYHAGILIMGELTGPTEMQVAVMLILIIVGIFGTDFYHSMVPILLAICVAGALAMCGMYARSVQKMVRENKSVHPVPDFFTALKQVLPYCGWLATTLFWVATTRETVEEYPTWYLLSVTLAFGAMTQQLIAQRICGEPIQFNYYIMIPYGAAAFYGLLKYLGIGNFVDGGLVLILVFFSSLFFEALFVNSIIRQLSTFLNIRPFHIVPKPPQQQPQPQKTEPPQTPPVVEPVPEEAK